jgi:hypothetical protein
MHHHDKHNVLIFMADSADSYKRIIVHPGNPGFNAESIWVKAKEVRIKGVMMGGAEAARCASP